MKKIWIATFIVAIVACGPKREGDVKMQIDNKPSTTYCIGRHLFVLPDYFTINPVVTGSFINGDADAKNRPFEVVVRHGAFTPRDFSAEMQKRRLELKSADDGFVDVLKLDKVLDNGATIFRVQKINEAYVSEINLLRDGNLITIKLDSFKKQYMSAEDALVKFAENVYPREEKITSGRSNGFCLGSIFIAGDFNSESGSFSFKDIKGQNFEIDIDTYAPDAEVKLLERMSGPGSLLNVFQVKPTVLRARERIVAGMHAQEWLGWAKLSEEEGAKTLKFALDTFRSKPGKNAPHIELTFNTAQPLNNGTRTNTVLSDDEAIQLWDSVVGSIRPVNP
jgi:hypothetical protein